MSANVATSRLNPQWEDLSLANTPNSEQLREIAHYLGTICVALSALGNFAPEIWVNTAQNLDLEPMVKDWLGNWQIGQSSARNTSTDKQDINLEEARSLVLIISHLAQQEQELIRRAVSLLEQRISEDKPPEQTALLGNYLDKFRNLAANSSSTPSEKLAPLAFKLLIDLLFYSGVNGHRRLWLAILDHAR